MTESAQPGPDQPGPDQSDPVLTDPELYRVLFENDRVRVLEYRDRPGDATHPHAHPDSVMVTLSSFRRRLRSGGKEVELKLAPFQARWVGAQEHSGTNIGNSDTHSIFVELKDPATTVRGPKGLGPSDS